MTWSHNYFTVRKAHDILTKSNNYDNIFGNNLMSEREVIVILGWRFYQIHTGASSNDQGSPAHSQKKVLLGFRPRET